MGEHFRFSEFIHIQKLGDVIHAPFCDSKCSVATVMPY